MRRESMTGRRRRRRAVGRRICERWEVVRWRRGEGREKAEEGGLGKDTKERQDGHLGHPGHLDGPGGLDG